MNDDPRNRRDEPGITWVPERRMPPPITDWLTETSVVHSKSRGWLPAVVLKIETADGLGLTGFVVVDEQLHDIIEGLLVAMERAPLDLEAAKRDGALPDV